MFQQEAHPQRREDASAHGEVAGVHKRGVKGANHPARGKKARGEEGGKVHGELPAVNECIDKGLREGGQRGRRGQLGGQGRQGEPRPGPPYARVESRVTSRQSVLGLPAHRLPRGGKRRDTAQCHCIAAASRARTSPHHVSSCVLQYRTFQSTGKMMLSFLASVCSFA